MIVDSVHVEGAPQADGRIPITETHTSSDGRVFKREWLSDGSLSAEAVLQAAAERFSAVLKERADALAAVVGIEVPYTKHEFLSRFTQAERIAIRAFARNGTPQGDAVGDFMEMLNASGGVYMTLARPGVAVCQQLGLVTAQRAVVIGAD